MCHICQISNGLVCSFSSFLVVFFFVVFTYRFGEGIKNLQGNFKEPKLVWIKYQHIWNVNTLFFLDNFLWFGILIWGVILSIPFFKGLRSRRILPLRLSHPVNLSKSRKHAKKPSGTLISAGSQSLLRNIHSCTEPSETFFFFIHRLMFSHQFIDWAEDATSAISILIEQNGMWACDVGTEGGSCFFLYTKSG